MVSKTVHDITEDMLAMEVVSTLCRVPSTSPGVTTAVRNNHMPEVMQRVLLITGEKTIIPVLRLLGCCCTQMIIHNSIMILVTSLYTGLVIITEVAPIQMNMYLVQLGQVCVMEVSSSATIIAQGIWIGVARKLKELQINSRDCWNNKKKDV